MVFTKQSYHQSVQHELCQSRPKVSLKLSCILCIYLIQLYLLFKNIYLLYYTIFQLYASTVERGLHHEAMEARAK